MKIKHYETGVKPDIITQDNYPSGCVFSGWFLSTKRPDLKSLVGCVLGDYTVAVFKVKWK